MPDNQPYNKCGTSAKVKWTFGNFSILQEGKGKNFVWYTAETCFYWRRAAKRWFLASCGPRCASGLKYAMCVYNHTQMPANSCPQYSSWPCSACGSKVSCIFFFMSCSSTIGVAKYALMWEWILKKCILVINFVMLYNDNKNQ